MTSDDDQGSDAPKRPGFLRRLFGGIAPAAPSPVLPPAASPDEEAELPPLEEIDPHWAQRPIAEPMPEPVAEPAVDEARPTELLPAEEETELPPLEDVDPHWARQSAVEPERATSSEENSFTEPVASEEEFALPPLEEVDPHWAQTAVDESAAEPDEPAPTAEPPAPRASWWLRLRQGLTRSSSAIGQGIADIFTKRKLDATTLEELDDILIRADLGVGTAARITEAVAKDRYDKAIDPEEVKAILAREVEAVLLPLARPLEIDRSRKPFTILMIGVNGSGKTTTIGKLAAKFTQAGHSVMLAAGDTFRAAAIEQLRVWGERAKAPVISRDQGADAAGLAFDAFKQAQAAGTDILLIDTAGRLQNRAELMDELAKVIRVLRKLDAAAPHAVLLVLDATVGQNAISQVDIFGKVAGVTGLIMTKLDGTARGGILVALAEKFKLPIHFIGIGEGVDDLEPFAARDFARAIAGLDEQASA